MSSKKTFFLFLSCLSFACFSLEEVTLYLKWKHQFQFAGYYMAQKLGFYEQEGLKVNIIERDFKKRPIDQVLEDKNSFGISDSSTVLYYLKGKPITIIATIFQHSPITLVTLKSQRILSPLELKDKKVMFQEGIDDGVVKGMFFNVGLTKKDFQPVEHAFSVEPLIKGEVDAVSSYATDLPYVLMQKGIEYDLVEPSEYGIDFYGDQIFTSQKTALAKPYLVEAFRRASIKGWNYALRNVDQTVNYISTFSDKDKGWLFFEAKETKKNILPNIIDVGTTSLARLERIKKVYVMAGEAQEVPEFENILFENLIEFHSLDEYLKRYLQPFFVILVSGFSLTMLFNFHLKRKVDEKTRELEEAYRGRDIFFSTITHELRTPLNGVLGAAEDLEASDLSQNQLELTSIITYSGQHLLNIVNDLLEFSKRQVSELRIKPNAIKLSETLNRLTLFYQRQARSKSLKFTSDLRIDSELIVYVDEKRIQQVLHNLLSNALKFTEKGEVTLRAQEKKKTEDLVTISFSVQDTGIGIEKENQKKIFEPFIQAKGGIDLGGHIGTGLGLPVAKEIVSLMGGVLEYHGNIPHGSIFEFSLELKIFDEAKIDISNHDIKVLVVDDIEINAKVLKSKLRKIGLNPTSVPSGYECLEKLKKEDIDIIFTDYNMPGMNGKELIEDVRDFCQKNKRETPLFVGCSAVDEGFHLGWDVDHELKKPYDRRDLIKIIDSFIRLKKTLI